MSFDLDRARAETPGVEHVVHLNNAGASLVPRPVVDVMTRYLELESEVGAYEAAERSRDVIEQTYTALARLLNCHGHEIAVLGNATTAWGMALMSVPLRRGDRVLLSPVEYGSNYVAMLHMAEKLDLSLEILDVDEDGVVDVDALVARLDERVKLIAVAHAPMHDGLINPVGTVGRVARRNGIWFLVDASQTVGQLPLDVDEIGCDILVGTGRKFLRGPRGTGFLYTRETSAHALVPPIVGLDGVEWNADGYRFARGARRFETWEANCASHIGLGMAVEYALGWGVDRTWARLRDMGECLRGELRRIPGVVVQDRGRERCGSIAVTFSSCEENWVRESLRSVGINTWVCLENAACVDMQARGLRELLRVSPHYYNSGAELDRFCTVLDELVDSRVVRVGE